MACRCSTPSPSRVESGAVITEDEHTIATDAALIATGASAAAWLRDTGLALDDLGFIAVNSHLQSISHPFVFAAGDVATLIETPRPKSGVYAVRAAPPLAHNLIAALTRNRFRRSNRSAVPVLVDHWTQARDRVMGAMGFRRPLGVVLERSDRSRLHCEVQTSEPRPVTRHAYACRHRLHLHHLAAAFARGRTVRIVERPAALRTGTARRQIEAAVAHAEQRQQPSFAMACSRLRGRVREDRAARVHSGLRARDESACATCWRAGPVHTSSRTVPNIYRCSSRRAGCDLSTTLNSCLTPPRELSTCARRRGSAAKTSEPIAQE